MDSTEIEARMAGHINVPPENTFPAVTIVLSLTRDHTCEMVPPVCQTMFGRAELHQDHDRKNAVCGDEVHNAIGRRIREYCRIKEP